MRGSQLLAVAQLNDLCNICNHIDHFHLFIKLKSFLRIITEPYRLTDIKRTAVRLLNAHQNLDERRFSRSVISHNTHLLIAGKDVGEIIQDLQIAETLVKMICFKNL